MAAIKKGGSKLSRSEVVTVRFDPKLKFAAELAARKQRRTVSSFIEWAVEQAIENVIVTHTSNNDITISDLLRGVWDVEEADRFINMVFLCPDLLTYEEEQILKIILETKIFWQNGEVPQKDSYLEYRDRLLVHKVRDLWDRLELIMDGELPSFVSEEWR
jgi:hypothetical protein